MSSALGNYLIYDDAGRVELNVGLATYGRGGVGAQIFYGIVPSAFGRILLAGTPGGVCWIGIHESEAYLQSELCSDFPHAVASRNDDQMHEVTQQVMRFVSRATRSLQIPLDVHATAFQLAVWRELCAIPTGTTRSYGEIAYRLGRPKAARAVGHANGSNPLAMVIPCHRAIGADGSVTGYRWGLEYKRRLLEAERAQH